MGVGVIGLLALGLEVDTQRCLTLTGQPSKGRESW